MAFWTWVERISGLTALVALPYLVIDKFRRRPRISFDFSGQSGKSFNQDGHEAYRFTFSGSIRNHSLDPNSIQKVFLVVWRNKKKTATKRFGYGAKSITDENKDSLSEPILFLPREGKKLTIIFESIIEGSADDKILSDLIPIFSGSNFLIHRDRYELAFEDLNGNFFDQKGKLLSRKLIDLNWGLDGSLAKLRDGDKKPYRKQRNSIVFSTIKWRLKQLLWLIGLV